MKRTPIERKSELARSGPSERKTPMRKVNRRRRAGLFALHYHSVERVLWVKRQPCVIERRRASDIVVAHHPGKGAGGTYRDTAPMRNRYHDEYHAKGPETFQAKYGVDLTAEAARTQAEWEAHLARRAA